MDTRRHTWLPKRWHQYHLPIFDNMQSISFPLHKPIYDFFQHTSPDTFRGVMDAYRHLKRIHPEDVAAVKAVISCFTTDLLTSVDASYNARR
jgi:hypothetical protein